MAKTKTVALKTIYNQELVEIQLATIVEWMPKSVSLQYKKNTCTRMAPVLEMVNVEPVTKSLNRPSIQAAGKLPTTLKYNPVSIGIENAAIAKANQLPAMLTQGEALGETTNSPIALNLATVTAIGLKQGKPQLVRQAISNVRGTGAITDFNNKALQLQTYRGNDGRFLSPEAADLGAAILTGIELESASIGNAFQSRTKKTGLTSIKQVGNLDVPWLSGSSKTKPLLNSSGGKKAHVSNPGMGFTSSKANVQIPLIKPLKIPVNHAKYLINKNMNVGGYFSDWADSLKWMVNETVVGDILSWVQEKCSALYNWFASWNDGFWANIQDFFSSVINFLQDAFNVEDLFTDFTGWFENLTDNTQELVVKAWTSVAEAAQSVTDLLFELVPMLEGVWDAIQGCVTDPLHCIQNILNALIGGILDAIIEFIITFFKGALQVIMRILGELGKALGKAMDSIYDYVLKCIRAEFGPFAGICEEIWKATWNTIKFVLSCCCDKACSQVASGSLKDANNSTIKVIGWILYLLTPLLQGDPIPAGLSLAEYPYSDMRRDSFCRWYLQAGQGLLPAPAIDEKISDLIGDWVSTKSEYFCDPNTCGAGPRYLPFMVDLVAKRYIKDTYGVTNVPGLSGSDNIFGKGYETLYWPEKSSLWYAKHPEEAIKAQQGFGLNIDGLTPVYNQETGKVDWEIVSSDITGDFDVSYGTDPNPWPARLGLEALKKAEEMLAGRCDTDSPDAWLNTLPNIKEECFNLHAVTYYNTARYLTMNLWRSGTEWDKDLLRAGNSISELIFYPEYKCDKDLMKWRVPDAAGEPSVWDMGFPTWQNVGTFGYPKHLPSNSNQNKYFAYYMDWLEANTMLPIMVSTEKYNAFAPSASSSSTTFTSPTTRKKSNKYTFEQVLSKTTGKSNIGSLGSVNQTSTATKALVAVGYETAHSRYQEIWKKLSFEDRIAWLADVPSDNNYPVYNPEGPPKAPALSPKPGASTSVEMLESQVGAGTWTTQNGGGFSTFYNNSDQAGTVKLGGTKQTVYEFRTTSTEGLKNQILAMGVWGSVPMTRKRFWAGEMMAFFKGTQYAYLSQPEVAEAIYTVLPDEGNSTEATPEADYEPNEDQEDSIVTADEVDDEVDLDITEVDDEVDLDITEEEVEKYIPKSEKSNIPWLLGAGSLLAAGAWFIITKDKDD